MKCDLHAWIKSEIVWNNCPMKKYKSDMKYKCTQTGLRLGRYF